MQLVGGSHIYISMRRKREGHVRNELDKLPSRPGPRQMNWAILSSARKSTVTSLLGTSPGFPIAAFVRWGG